MERIATRFQRVNRKVQIVVSIVFILFFCCGSLVLFATVDNGLRSVGILPTLTPKPTATQTPTATLTPAPTQTATQTPTSLPSSTPVPTQTPTPSPTRMPTNTPAPLSIPPTPEPSPVIEPSSEVTLEPTTPPQPSAAQVVIIAVNKRTEYVDIQNIGGTSQDLAGWRLLSERGNQSCALGGVIEPSQVLRIWAMAADAGQGGFNCGFDGPIWNNNEPDPAVLFNADGVEVSRR